MAHAPTFMAPSARPLNEEGLHSPPSSNRSRWHGPEFRRPCSDYSKPVVSTSMMFPSVYLLKWSQKINHFFQIMFRGGLGGLLFSIYTHTLAFHFRVIRRKPSRFGCGNLMMVSRLLTQSEDHRRGFLVQAKSF